MKRGEIWTVAGGPGYAGKPRPALILQSDLLIRATLVVTCGFTTASEPEEPVRGVRGAAGNGDAVPAAESAQTGMAEMGKALKRERGEIYLPIQ